MDLDREGVSRTLTLRRRRTVSNPNWVKTEAARLQDRLIRTLNPRPDLGERNRKKREKKVIQIDSKFHQTLTLESPNPRKDENEHRVLPGPSSRRRHRHRAGKRLLAGVREDGRATPPRGLGLQRAPPWLSSTVPRAALAARARRREGPWRRHHLHFLLWTPCAAAGYTRRG